MPSSTSTATTAADQWDRDAELTELVNTDSTLPTHHVTPRAHTLPPAYDPDPYNNSNSNQTIALRARAAVTARLTERTWFLHVERYASVIGLIIAVAALIVTVIGIIVGVIVAVVVK